MYAESDKRPDFKIQQNCNNDFKLTYRVECKYRKAYNSSDNILIKQYQLSRYRTIQRETKTKVLVAIGMGYNPAKPSTFYLIPLDSIKNENISQEELSHFKILNPQYTISTDIYRYFQTVFKASRSRKK